MGCELGEAQTTKSKFLLNFEQSGSQLQLVTRKTFYFWRSNVKLRSQVRMLLAMQNEGHALDAPGRSFLVQILDRKWE